MLTQLIQNQKHLIPPHLQSKPLIFFFSNKPYWKTHTLDSHCHHHHHPRPILAPSTATIFATVHLRITPKLTPYLKIKSRKLTHCQMEVIVAIHTMSHINQYHHHHLNSPTTFATITIAKSDMVVKSSAILKPSVIYKHLKSQQKSTHPFSISKSTPKI